MLMTKTAGSRKGLLAFYILNGGQSKGMDVLVAAPFGSHSGNDRVFG